jgi:uncharacterized membrane protein
MNWLILSLLTALAVSTQDAWVKKYFSHLSAYHMVAYPALYSLPLFTAGLCVIERPPLDGVYLWCLLISLPLNGISFVLYMRAIKISPLSLTLPYLAFTPVFMIITGVLILDEVPNLWGITGIFTTCLGGYILNLDPARLSLWAPFKAVFRETGSWLMLIVAFIFSFAAVVGKQGILHSSVFFFTFSFAGYPAGDLRANVGQGIGRRYPVFPAGRFPRFRHLLDQGSLHDIPQTSEHSIRCFIRRHYL